MFIYILTGQLVVSSDGFVDRVISGGSDVTVQSQAELGQ
jgi:hypothetical protein